MNIHFSFHTIATRDSHTFFTLPTSQENRKWMRQKGANGVWGWVKEVWPPPFLQRECWEWKFVESSYPIGWCDETSGSHARSYGEIGSDSRWNWHQRGEMKAGKWNNSYVKFLRSRKSTSRGEDWMSRSLCRISQTPMRQTNLNWTRLNSSDIEPHMKKVWLSLLWRTCYAPDVVNRVMPFHYVVGLLWCDISQGFCGSWLVACGGLSSRCRLRVLGYQETDCQTCNNLTQ